MPTPAKWRRDGTSASPKPFDLILRGLGGDDRLQISSGTRQRSTWELRRNAIREAWALGGVQAEAVRALGLKRFDIDAFMQARAKGKAELQALLERAGSEPVRDAMKDYLSQSQATDKKHMQEKLDRFADYLGKSASVADVTTANVEAFLSRLTDKRTGKKATPAKGSTVNRYRAAIGGMCTWACRKGRMTNHPIAGKKVEKRPEPHHRLPELSADEYRDYLGAARAVRADLVVVLLLLLHTAPDVGELFARETRDADFETKRMRYQRTKTERFGALPRFVPMPSVVLEELRAHVAEHQLRGSQRLFAMFDRQDVEWLHKQAVKAIKRPELTLKDLRHVAAIAWVKAGVHIRLVSRWLGHRSLGQTMKYTDYEPDAEAANAMAERAAETLNQTADVVPLRMAQ